MLLPCVIIALVTIGFVGPCVLDIAATPRQYFDLPTKRMWLVAAGFAAVIGVSGMAVVLARRSAEGVPVSSAAIDIAFKRAQQIFTRFVFD